MLKRSLIGLAMLAMVGCGSSGSGSYAPPPPAPAPAPAPTPTPSPTPTPTPGNKPTDAQVTAIIQKDCGGCHNGSQEPSLLPLTTFKSSAALSFLRAGQMPPPPKSISADDKASLVAYLGG